MKILVCLLLALSSPALAAPDDCFLLVRLEPRGERVVEQRHPDRLSRRFQACSTFKVAAALMAYDRGLLPPGRTRLRAGL